MPLLTCSAQQSPALCAATPGTLILTPDILLYHSAAPAEGRRWLQADVTVDFERRFDHMQQHSGEGVRQRMPARMAAPAC